MQASIYKRLTITTNALPSLRMIAYECVANLLFSRILGACFLSSHDPKNANEQPKNAYEHLRISCDHCESPPNCMHRCESNLKLCFTGGMGINQ